MYIHGKKCDSSFYTLDSGQYSLDLRIVDIDDNSLSQTYTIGKFCLRKCIEIGYYLGAFDCFISGRPAKGRKYYQEIMVPCVVLSFKHSLKKSLLSFIDVIDFTTLY